MAGETTITIIGNLTADPELRYTATGLPVAGFTIASSSRTYNKQVEQWQDGEALFMRCSAWRDLGEHVAASLTRGTRVIASGRLRMRTYEISDGDKRTVIEMTVDEIGPSLRFATTEVHKAARTRGNGNGTGAAPTGGGFDDPWASTTPAPAASAAGGDEPPF
ncbi:single-strand DNA-binding protein [Thermocatellispora tengchongensis]|uniref:Single-stranded DNA-binding protein n=1 Tax=Thermocatellispora tengchongensis TaxID=1073253 RepID=A0A840NVQ3_9ACTN|nr:single-stranded DNA-binding protein [Thermocatellispora tengchongensis]MBB5132874.1 single-strand DNA-binding protein [Thermocatellispora tengchongensis]